MRIYQSVHRCIYCERDLAQLTADGSRELTDEHVIPYALNGELLFKGASCKRCEKLINCEIDQPMLTGQFLLTRMHLDMQSRSSKKRPKVGKMGTGPDNAIVWTDVPIERHPFIAIMPILTPPWLLSGQEPEDKESITIVGASLIGSKDAAAKMKQGSSFQLLTPGPFARFLAKIAHGYLLGQTGDLYEPILQGIVLGRDTHLSAYVGAGPETVPQDKVGLHRLEIKHIGDFVVVSIQLFSFHNTITYDVVAGKLRSADLVQAS